MGRNYRKLSASMPSLPNSESPFAAVFLDFENVYYFFKNEFADPPEINDHILEMLRNLRAHLSEQFGLDSIILNAYADFERIESAPQGPLYLLGVDTKNVLGTDHKNAADMRLCIDVLEVLYTRPEIGTFVLVAGDRDYIPVIQHLRRQARRVLGVGFRESVSGDLLLNLGDKGFIDARELLDAETLERLEERRREFQKQEAERQRRFEEQAREIDQKVAQARQTEAAPAPPSAPPRPVEPMREAPEIAFAPPRRIEDEDELHCLEFALEKLRRIQETHYNSANELWLGPFLRHLADELPLLADWERRRLLEGLANRGALRIEKRPGEPYPYSVMILNYNHPDVWDPA